MRTIDSRLRCYSIHTMRLLYFCALFMAAMLPGLAQTAANTGPGLPSDPREVFAAAAPFYDFNSPELKPWHLKASYQLYDEKGKPSEQGTYEYWWASPQVYRSTWTRPSATHTEWHLGNGELSYESTGEPLSLFEFKLQAALFSPLPNRAALDPAKFRLEDEGVAANGASGPCITVVPRITQEGAMNSLEQGPFPTYCFESQRPVLQSVYSFERVLTQFSDVVQTQGKYIAGDLIIIEGKHKLLATKIDDIDMISPSEPAMIPTSSAIRTNIGFSQSSSLKKVEINKEVMVGYLIKKVTPIYPIEARKARIQGKVVIAATIGTDGKIHAIRVISAPSASLADSSFQSVSQWGYKPYLLNGEPVPVETTIVVTYALGK